MTEIAIALLLALAGVLIALAVRRRMAARRRVNAECLVCTYLETCEDLTAARKAGNEHAAAAGHVLMLVKAGNGPA
jgi:hypothetical protein